MELGELLFAITQKIIGYAETEFSNCGLPATLRPLVMESVNAHFTKAAYDHLIAAKIAAQGASPDTSKPEESPDTDSGKDDYV